MTVAEQLRALVKEATPFAPHDPKASMPEDLSEMPDEWFRAHARLIALAPQLAELVADMGEALKTLRFCPECRHATENHPTACGFGRAMRRLDALFSEEDE